MRHEVDPILHTRLLRSLTINASDHPHGATCISAASGLVCHGGRAHVIGDDELHLATFRNAHDPGQLHRVLPGYLPTKAKARKRAKPDFESLLAWPVSTVDAAITLMALGSGSRPQRCQAVALALDASGAPVRAVQRFDLSGLYRPLMARLGEINIEGALVVGAELILLHRGGQGGADNAAVRWPLQTLLRALADGHVEDTPPSSITHYELGHLDGTALGFTDAAALPGGGWIFSAAAERSSNSFDDGALAGSVVGVVGADGQLTALHRLDKTCKVEGIAARALPGGTDVCLVTDADDISQPASMLLTQL